MGIGNYFMNTNVDLFHDSTNNSNGILTSESNEMDLNTLIPVVDNNNHKVVDARLLHAFLQIRRDFTSWIKDRISKYGFIENQDFVLIKYDYLGNLLNDRLPHFGESDTQVVAKTDYLLLMDMAKELCMVENNDKGKKARRYFIEKEKELKKLEKSNNDQVSHLRIPDFSNPAEAARAWADEYEAKVTPATSSASCSIVAAGFGARRMSNLSASCPSISTIPPIWCIPFLQNLTPVVSKSKIVISYLLIFKMFLNLLQCLNN